MNTQKFKFWSRNYEITRVLMFLEFWIFVVLRERHVIQWSWWWLVAFQAGSLISAFTAHGKLKRVID